MLRLVRPPAAPCMRATRQPPPIRCFASFAERTLVPPRSAYCYGVQPPFSWPHVSIPLQSPRACFLLSHAILLPRRCFASPSSNSSKPKQTPPSRPSQSTQTHAGKELFEERNQSMLIYLVAVVLVMVSLSYLAVPFYQLFCQTTGYGGTVKETDTFDANKYKEVDPVKARQITIRFEGTVSQALPWKFEPSQSEVHVVPGETALAFYRATNLVDEPIIGVSTYNVMPMKAGVHFNKIQCFCFEEQRLLPHESIEMPVLFYIDPAMLDDREMRGVDKLTLSYTFFRSLNDDMV